MVLSLISQGRERRGREGRMICEDEDEEEEEVEKVDNLGLLLNLKGALSLSLSLLFHLQEFECIFFSLKEDKYTVNNSLFPFP